MASELNIYFNLKHYTVRPDYVTYKYLVSLPAHYGDDYANFCGL